MRAVLVIALTLALSAFVATRDDAQAEQRIALVVGNAEYTTIARLRNPEHDAALIANTLEHLGFQVILKTDADRRTLARAILEFGDRLAGAGENAVGLFYFAGHGVQAGGRNYLVPLGAMIATEAELEIEAVDANWVLSQMKEAGDGLKIVILDACRNNPFQSSFRSAARGLARLEAPAGSLVAYSAAPGQTARDGDGRNSPYTSALARAMLEPGLELVQMFRQVRVEVEEKTVGAQTPWEEQSLRRDFYFQASPAGTAELDSQARDGVETEFEMAYWNTVRDSGDADLLQAYLDRYPGGTFAPIAGLLLERMAASQAAAPLADAAGPQSPAGLGDSANAVVATIAPALGVPANSPPAPATPEPADLARSIQSALLEVGCNPGPVDGLWGRRSQKALEAFATHASVTLADDPISPSTLEMIEARETRVCPLSCGPREEVKDGACVTKTCARGLVLNRSGNCVARQASQQGSSGSSSGSSGGSRSSTPDTAEAPEPAEERQNGCVQVFVGTGGLTFGGFGGGDGC